jgi:hypothetical protein
MPAGGFEVAQVPEQDAACLGLVGAGLEELPAEVPAGSVEVAAVVAVRQGQALGLSGQVSVEGARRGQAAGVEVLHLGRESLGCRIAAAAWHDGTLRCSRHQASTEWQRLYPSPRAGALGPDHSPGGRK